MKFVFKKFNTLFSLLILLVIIFVSILLNFSPFKQIYLSKVSRIFDSVQAGDNDQIISKANDNAFTFIKHYRIEDWSESRGIFQTRDGGYVFTGQGLYDKKGLVSDEDAFIAKVDAQGNSQWTKLWQSFHLVKIDKSYAGTARKGEESGRDVVELNDGSLLMATQGTGFIDSKYLKLKERWNDIFLSKFDKQGNHLWTKMIGDYSTDRVYKVFATKDNGFIFSGYFTQTGFGEKTAPTYFVVAKFDKNGKRIWSQKLDMNNVDIKPLADGSFVALGSAKTTGRESGPAEKFADAVVPVVVKFNANFGIEWSRSLEIIPLEESIYTTGEDGHTRMTYQTKRNSAGKFFSIEQTTDGYLAMGFLSPILSGGSIFSTPAGKHSLTAVKLNNSGELQWAKSIKLGMQYGQQFNNDVSNTNIIKTKDNGFVFKMDYLPLRRSDQENRQDLVDERLQQLNDLCESKNRVEDCDNGKITNDPELLLAWENYIKMAKSFDTTLNNGILLVKTDAEFNPQWSKKISLEDYVYGYGMAPTSDNGIIISGSYNTSILSYITSMGHGYFVDTLLIKLDVNGNVTNDQGMITDYADLSINDVGPFLSLRDFMPVVKGFILKIDKKVQPKTPIIKTKVIDIDATVVNTAESASSANLPTITSSQIPPISQTWAEINYATASDNEEIKPIFKSAIQIHQELLPILNQTFANEVKLNKDVFGGLEYTMGRLVNENDKIVVQKYLEGIGYKTYLAEGDQLVMMKIGRTLTITFSFADKTKGTVFVTY